MNDNNLREYLLEEYKSVKDLVNELLETDEEARNNDTYLIAKVWDRKYGVKIPEELINQLPSAETITRCRRKVQNDEKRHLPKESISNHREERQESTRAIIGDV